MSIFPSNIKVIHGITREPLINGSTYKTENFPDIYLRVEKTGTNPDPIVLAVTLNGDQVQEIVIDNSGVTVTKFTSGPLSLQNQELIEIHVVSPKSESISFLVENTDSTSNRELNPATLFKGLRPYTVGAKLGIPNQTKAISSGAKEQFQYIKTENLKDIYIDPIEMKEGLGPLSNQEVEIGLIDKLRVIRDEFVHPYLTFQDSSPGDYFLHAPLSPSLNLPGPRALLVKVDHFSSEQQGHNIASGYYGVTIDEEFITPDSLVTQLGIKTELLDSTKGYDLSGSALGLGSNPGWYKYYFEGRVLYIPRLRLATSIPYEFLERHNLVDGSRRITFKGKEYRVRLIRALAPGINDDTIGGRNSPEKTIDSEWDRLIYNTVRPGDLTLTNKRGPSWESIAEIGSSFGTVLARAYEGSKKLMVTRGGSGQLNANIRDLSTLDTTSLLARGSWVPVLEAATDDVNVLDANTAVLYAHTENGFGVVAENDINRLIPVDSRIKSGTENVIYVMGEKNKLLPQPGPGPKSLVGWIKEPFDENLNKGYYGSVHSRDLITSEELIKLVGLENTGTVINRNVDWLKFLLDGKVLFIPRRSILTNFAFNVLEANNLVSGDRIIQIGDNQYRIRLLKGYNHDYTGTVSFGPDFPITHNSEWNRLIYNVMGGTSYTASQTGPKWEEFPTGDVGEGLGIQTANAGGTWCQDAHPSRPENQIIRGSTSYPSQIGSGDRVTASTSAGWRPVLELIPSDKNIFPVSNIRFSGRLKRPSFNDLGPGPTDLIGYATGENSSQGFYGEVVSEEELPNSGEVLDLAYERGKEGAIPDTDVLKWLKYLLDGEIIYVPFGPVHTKISWDKLNTNNLIGGSRLISKRGRIFKIRLMTGRNPDSSRVSVRDDYSDIRSGWGSEWNRLLYNSVTAHSTVPNQIYLSKTSQEGENWADYRLEDLGLDKGYAWCQESLSLDNALEEQRILRGGPGIVGTLTRFKSTSAEGSCWWPVVELTTYTMGSFNLPGPSNLRDGFYEPFDGQPPKGYLGLLPAENFIDSTRLNQHSRLAFGTANNSMSEWMKFWFRNKILYIPNSVARTGISYTHIRDACLEIGDLLIGIKDGFYRVRLIEGVSGDPVVSAGSIPVDGKITHNSEWNELIYNVINETPERKLSQRGAQWEFFTASSFNNPGGSANYIWVSGFDLKNTAFGLVRQLAAPASINSNGATVSSAPYAWLPCLEFEGSLIPYRTSRDDIGIGNPILERVAQGDINSGLYEGFFGEVPSSDFVTGDELMALLNIFIGRAQSTEPSWLKTYMDGEIIFISKKALRYNVSYEELENANLITGQREVFIRGSVFKVSLLKGVNPNQEGSIDTNIDSVSTHFSEWNRLMYRLTSALAQFPKTSMKGPFLEPYPQTDTVNGTAISGGFGSRAWTQETNPDNPEEAIARGSGVSAIVVRPKSEKTGSTGWRPALRHAITVGDFPDDLPGTKRLLGRTDDDLYFGEVGENDFLSSNELFEKLGVNFSVRFNGELTWLKFHSGGKLLYVSKVLVARQISFYSLLSNDLVHGTRTITVNGKIFKVRLLEGGTETETSSIFGYDTPPTHGSEWNRLMYPIAKDNPDYPKTSQKGETWAENDLLDLTGYTNISGEVDGSTFCLPNTIDDTNTIIRGDKRGVTYARTSGINGLNSGIGWRPVLEYVRDVDPDYEAPFQHLPGPSLMMERNGLDGLFGFTQSEDLISNEEIKARLSIDIGFNTYPDTDWIKFLSDGKLIYVPRKPALTGVNWGRIRASSAGGGERLEIINGNVFRIRLLSGFNNETQNGKGTEWNRLFLPLVKDLNPNATNFEVLPNWLDLPEDNSPEGIATKYRVSGSVNIMIDQGPNNDSERRTRGVVCSLVGWFLQVPKTTRLPYL